MSTSLTLRRADPEYLAGLTEEEGVSFALCQDGTATENAIEFFAPWHIIHFLSSGTEWDMTLPAGFMIGGTYWVSVHPDEEPFRQLSADEVKAIDTHLSDLPKDLVDERLKALSSSTTSIYGGPLPSEAFAQVLDILDTIKAFFSTAAEKGQSVVKAMS